MIKVGSSNFGRAMPLRLSNNNNIKFSFVFFADITHTFGFRSILIVCFPFIIFANK